MIFRKRGNGYNVFRDGVFIGVFIPRKQQYHFFPERLIEFSYADIRWLLKIHTKIVERDEKRLKKVIEQ